MTTRALESVDGPCERRRPQKGRHGAGLAGVVAARLQPLLRRPAAMPLIDRWMPRRTRSSWWPSR